MRKLLMIPGLTLSSVALAVVPAFADNTALNSWTGAHSTNVATAASSCTSTITQSNNGNITNNLTVTANTGNNEANQNTGDGSVTTGNASAPLALTNGGNSNTASPGCGSPPHGGELGSPKH